MGWGGSWRAGYRWSLSTTTAPSILQSSNSQFAVKGNIKFETISAHSRTFSLSPTQMRAPRRPCHIERGRRARSRLQAAVGHSFSVAPRSVALAPLNLPQLLTAYRLRLHSGTFTAEFVSTFQVYGFVADACSDGLKTGFSTGAWVPEWPARQI